MKNLIVGSFVILFFACQQKKDEVIMNNELFDIEVYLANFKQLIQQESIMQYNEINGKGELLKKTTKDIEPLFDLIAKTNINRSSFYDKYKITRLDKGNTEQIIYTSLDDGLKVQELKVIKSGEQVLSVDIYEMYKTLISRSNRHIILYENGTIELKKETNNKLGEPGDLLIKWYVNKVSFESDAKNRLN